MLTVFPWQRCLRERATTLWYTYSVAFVGVRISGDT